MSNDPAPDRVLVYARIKPQSKATALKAATSGSNTHPSTIAVRPAEACASPSTSADESAATTTKSKVNNNKSVCIENPTAGTGETRKFQLDRVFGPESTQGEVYEALGAPVLTDVLAGCRGCVLAYGEEQRGDRWRERGAHTQTRCSYSYINLQVTALSFVLGFVLLFFY